MKGPDVDLIRACKLWDLATENMKNEEYELPDDLAFEDGEGGPYTSGDYAPLRCTIMGSRAELTVGSASGHKVEVNLEKGTLRYYDNDRVPNRIVRELLEEDAGLDCKGEYDGVSCKGLNRENVQEAYKILAMPTSMDYRVGHCIEKSGESDEEIRSTCEEQCNDYLQTNYALPDWGCDCEEWQNDCEQDCIDNWEGEEGDEDECVELEKKFYREGVKKLEESLTPMQLASYHPGQKKIGGY